MNNQDKDEFIKQVAERIKRDPDTPISADNLSKIDRQEHETIVENLIGKYYFLSYIKYLLLGFFASNSNVKYVTVGLLLLSPLSSILLFFGLLVSFSIGFSLYGLYISGKKSLTLDKEYQQYQKEIIDLANKFYNMVENRKEYFTAFELIPSETEGWLQFTIYKKYDNDPSTSRIYNKYIEYYINKKIRITSEDEHKITLKVLPSSNDNYEYSERNQKLQQINDKIDEFIKYTETTLDAEERLSQLQKKREIDTQYQILELELKQKQKDIENKVNELERQDIIASLQVEKELLKTKHMEKALNNNTYEEIKSELEDAKKNQNLFDEYESDDTSTSKNQIILEFNPKEK
ncbi:hypothetical protein [Rubeoparvulum massiliense]|uniref:hypothetical protein n=1 Tax=Rubeoparvulum massiliense TaxID=1631346 RepID=UPI00065DD2DA|nr:hypothetical protein [Rubeoparvulum massiliense]